MLKLQYFGHLIQRANSLEKTLMLGNIKGRRKRGGQRMRWLDGITDTKDMSLSKFQEMVKDREVWHAAVHYKGQLPVHGAECTRMQRGSAGANIGEYPV